jgi:arsenate reductase
MVMNLVRTQVKFHPNLAKFGAWAQSTAGVQGDMAAVTIYGIRNCDTMKKARAWLEQHGVAYAFHDYKAAGMDRRALEGWARVLGWETLLNRAGTTFRALPEKDKADLSEKKAIALMMAQPSMIKRPVLETGRGLLVGFKPDQYEKAFAH